MAFLVTSRAEIFQSVKKSLVSLSPSNMCTWDLFQEFWLAPDFHDFGMVWTLTLYGMECFRCNQHIWLVASMPSDHRIEQCWSPSSVLMATPCWSCPRWKFMVILRWAKQINEVFMRLFNCYTNLRLVVKGANGAALRLWGQHEEATFDSQLAQKVLRPPRD
jgi:hypothetical protein